MLRIAVEETDAPCPMGKKFGAPEEMWDEILTGCKRIKADIRGVSFHVGSGGCNPAVYLSALEGARQIFDKVKKLKMKPMDLLDIGGGFAQSVGTSCDASWQLTNTEYNFDRAAPIVLKYI